MEIHENLLVNMAVIIMKEDSGVDIAQNLDVGFSRQGQYMELSYNTGGGIRMFYSCILGFCFKNMNINIVHVCFGFITGFGV